MENLSEDLTSQLEKAFTDAFHIPPPANLFSMATSKHYGYSTKNLAKAQNLLKSAGYDLKLPEIVEQLRKGLNETQWKVDLENGFLNLSLTNSHLNTQIGQLLKHSNLFPRINKKKILVDYSSPNIAKDMHVGHLRSTIIGDSIAHLFEKQGHKVLRINHIGDYGLQFGMIIQHLFETCPDYLQSQLGNSDLQNFYIEAKKRFDTDEEFQKQSYQRTVDLQTGNATVVEAWKWMKAISQASYGEIYKRLNIQLDEVGESFYQPFIPDLITELTQKGLVEEVEGRRIVSIKGFKVPLTIQKSDGGSTYDTTDLAALKYRLTVLNQDEIYYVVDSGQNLHFELIFKVAQMAGWQQPHQKVQHIGFGVVLGEDGKKFRSRDGNTVKLIDLLNEGRVKAQEVVAHRPTALEDNTIADRVAYGSIKYADLSTDRLSDYVFSFDKMLSLKGNTGAYQLYEYVRICAILRKSGSNIDELMSHLGDIQIEDATEVKLCQLLLQFPEIIAKVTTKLNFHLLCTYLYDISTAFSSFHTQCRCLDFNTEGQLIKVNQSRLLICLATQKIIGTCFEILGLQLLENM